jgi:hypothetical protein
VSRHARSGSASIRASSAPTAATLSSNVAYTYPSTARRSTSNARSAGLGSGLAGGC